MRDFQVKLYMEFYKITHKKPIGIISVNIFCW